MCRKAVNQSTTSGAGQRLLENQESAMINHSQPGSSRKSWPYILQVDVPQVVISETEDTH